MTSAGWRMGLVVPVEPGVDGHIITLTVSGKDIKLVQQAKDMRVFVCPDPEGLEQWEIPVGQRRYRGHSVFTRPLRS